MEGFSKMGGKPETVYSDDEPALSSKYTKQFFNEQHIRFITTRTHAGVAERQIRTLGICYIREWRTQKTKTGVTI